MKYLSVCSGIEAASVAWHPLGWKPIGFSEIEPFPSAVLAHHYPDVPNLGDMTQYATWPRTLCPDLLVGGTPCQSFSVAGLRKGLDDPRGSLMLTFGAIAAKYRPRWVVWENVPGVLSSDAGRDFASFLGLLTGQRIEPPADGWQNAGVCEGIASAYGLAWRVLDAQFAGVPQRRRRVFVVGHLGDWRRAAAVLFERESLRGDPPPRRKTGEGLAPTISARTRGGGGLGTDFDCDGGLIANPEKWPAEVAPTLNAAFGEKQGLEDQHALGGAGLFVMSSGQANAAIAKDLAHPLDCLHETQVIIGAPSTTGPITAGIAKGPRGTEAVDSDWLVTHSLRGEGFDGSEDGTGRGIPLVTAIQAGALKENPDIGPDGAGFRTDGQAYTLEARSEVQAVAFDPTQITSKTNRSNPQSGDPCHTLAKGTHAPCIAFPERMSGTQCAATENLSPSLGAKNPTAIAFEPRYYTRDNKTGGAPSDVAVLKADASKAGDSSPHVAITDVKQVQWSSGGGQLENDTAQALRSGAEHNYQFLRTASAVRRLTPRECERLQGFPDDYTAIPHRGKPAADGPRYKALGNSMAVPVMRWIGKRIALLESILPTSCENGVIPSTDTTAPDNLRKSAQSAEKTY